MGKKKYIIEVGDEYVMDLYKDRKLLCPLSIGVGGGKEMYLNTGFVLEEYREPGDPGRPDRPYKVGDIVQNLYDQRIVVITRLNDDGTMNVMDSDGSFHIYNIFDVKIIEGSTAMWLSLKVLQKLEGEKNE